MLGSSDISGRKFFALNAVGAGVWAVAFALIGYAFGSLLESVLIRILDNVHHAEMLVLGLVAAVVVGLWLFKAVRRRRS